MMDSAKKSDVFIMAEAIRLVGEGVSVSFPVNGCSMLPFIVGGRDSVILEKPENLRVGDVVLAHAIPDNVALLENAEKRYVIHRIVNTASDLRSMPRLFAWSSRTGKNARRELFGGGLLQKFGIFCYQ